MADKTKAALAKALEKATLVVSKKVEGDENTLLARFHEALCASTFFAKTAQGAAISEEELVDIVRRFREFGLGWDKGVYIPLQAFCAKKPLKHILSHIAELRGLKGHEAFTNEALEIKEMFLLTFVGMFFRY